MLSIDDQDIDKVETLLGYDFDPPRRAVLRCLTTTDIRACPGSGKTTLILAKLAMLLGKWPYTQRGVCVLSHTNVAKNLIRRRFAASLGLPRLLSYPHFVGTIHSFFDQFLAIPAAIEKFGARPICIDNEQYEFEARRRFAAGCRGARPAYRTAADYIRARIKNHPQYRSPVDYVACEVEYSGPQLDLKVLDLVTAGSESLRQLTEFKAMMSRAGYFRFQDTIALSAWYLTRHPQLPELLRRRFPIVLIDEMQDTVLEQGGLLDQAFRDGGILQRFGDDRQAIYHSPRSTDGTVFPGPCVMTIPQSKRLSRSIAKLVQHVCAGQREEIFGDPEKVDLPHTLFVFSRSSILDVIPAFARLVGANLGPNSNANDVRVVGLSTVVKPEPDKFPSAVGDYWKPYRPKAPLSRAALKTMADYFRMSQRELRSHGATTRCSQLLLEGCAKAVELERIANGLEPLSPSSIIAALSEHHPKHHAALRYLVADVCRSLLAGHPSPNMDFASRLRTILSPLIGGTEWCESAQYFLASESCEEQDGDSHLESTPTDDTFVCNEGGIAVRARLGTIHSVKGETVRAILVLETLFHEHDIRAVLASGVLLGRPQKKPLGKRLTQHVKRLYVAMSRPTHLLCLAILDEHISGQDEDELQKVGWRIRHI